MTSSPVRPRASPLRSMGSSQEANLGHLVALRGVAAQASQNGPRRFAVRKGGVGRALGHPQEVQRGIGVYGEDTSNWRRAFLDGQDFT